MFNIAEGRKHDCGQIVLPACPPPGPFRNDSLETSFMHLVKYFQELFTLYRLTLIHKYNNTLKALISIHI